MDVSVDFICGAALYVTRKVIDGIVQDLHRDPNTALESVYIGERKKKALTVDVTAQRSFRAYLEGYHGGKIKAKFLGEETLRDPNLNLSASSGVHCLIDPVDGTDLVERGLSNWCSATVFFDPARPSGNKILAAFVGIPTGEIYYACNGNAGALLNLRGKKTHGPVGGPSSVTRLVKSSLCFYGQKPKNLLSIVPLLNRLNEKHSESKDEFRIYNLGGIPMMMKMIDHRVKHSRGIDAIIELDTQKVHDVVAGAYIAKKAGAIMRRLSGDDITYSDLENALLTPSKEMEPYILASTKDLSTEILSLLNESKKLTVATISVNKKCVFSECDRQHLVSADANVSMPHEILDLVKNVTWGNSSERCNNCKKDVQSETTFRPLPSMGIDRLD